MSPHDILMSRIVALQNYLESYCEEFKPSLAEPAMRKLTEAGILISKFVDDDDDFGGQDEANNAYTQEHQN